MHIRQIILEYLSERQPPVVRIFHVLILLLVVSQILVSNFMGFTDNGEISKKTIEHYGTWIHIGTGLSLLPIAFVFVYIELMRHGIKYFFPYLYGDVAQLKSDLQQLKRFELPEPTDYGIAAIVKGLGLGALVLVVLSGATWFISWVYMPALAHNLKEVHETLTGLIEAYVVGHGAIGVLHIYLDWKNKKIAGNRVNNDS